MGVVDAGPTVIQIIQGTLAPIFLVSGGAIFLNFTQARLFRVIDRLRALGKEMASASAEARADLVWQQRRSFRRAIVLRNAILFGVLVIAFTVLTALLLLLSDVITGWDPGRWPILSFAIALISFAIALGFVVADAFLSVAAARHGLREFQERRG